MTGLLGDVEGIKRQALNTLLVIAGDSVQVVNWEKIKVSLLVK